MGRGSAGGWLQRSRTIMGIETRPSFQVEKRVSPLRSAMRLHCSGRNDIVWVGLLIGILRKTDRAGARWPTLATIQPSRRWGTRFVGGQNRRSFDSASRDEAARGSAQDDNFWGVRQRRRFRSLSEAESPYCKAGPAPAAAGAGLSFCAAIMPAGPLASLSLSVA